MRWKTAPILLVLPFAVAAALFVMSVSGSCLGRRRSIPAHTSDGLLLRLYTEQELNTLIRPGMTRQLVISTFGQPVVLRHRSGGADVLEFWISDRNMKIPARHVLSSFGVVLSNDVVVGWEPLSYTSCIR